MRVTNNDSCVWVSGEGGGGNHEGMEREERILYAGSRGREKKGNTHISIPTQAHVGTCMPK